ncbi:phosphodiesterase [Roseivivax halodurans JCM 10272]|uniref:Phosphodiesterase n=1 Tax=Roseivivax halodurans JCM 10272 TaxID=1449350 RepID=X7ECL8_9RHOB|nr:glycerophosphodiester phosphodiesterase family protein [Roseivivax halodurans]ETX13829.1 phosphodiesterase [Roseivivax halodurans JCM 10272]
MTGPKLPGAFLSRPIAHRAYHDAGAGRPENSRAAIRAAIEAGYGIEIDLQLSADGAAMVFHDYHLDRLTDGAGAIRMRDAANLSALTLRGGSEGIPTLAEVLEVVDGQVPLLVEIKDQDGQLGPMVGLLEQAAATAMDGYKGPLAVMSFNPNSVAAVAELLPDVPRGLTTCAFSAEDWPILDERTRSALAAIPDMGRTGASFISHDRRDLGSKRVAELVDEGIDVLCWTIRSKAEEAEARRFAANVTFEGYAA